MGFSKSAPAPHARPHGGTLILFDVDGTLAVPAQPANEAMIRLLARLRSKYAVGIVGAGDFNKQQMQLGGPDLRERLDFCFSENGVHAFRGTEQLHCKSIAEELGEALWQAFDTGLRGVLEAERRESDRLLQLIQPGASIDQRGTFLECRQCTVNICPIGRTPALTKEERASFDAADREAGLRHRLLEQLVQRFGPGTEYNLTFSIGGQIGIDVCPTGWDKTFCLQFVPNDEFETVHFFGDKTQEGGGDFELFTHPRTIGHTVSSPEDTMEQVESIFLCPATN